MTEYRLPRVVPMDPATIGTPQVRALSGTHVLPREDTDTQPLTRCRVGMGESTDFNVLAICHRRWSVAITVTDADVKRCRFIQSQSLRSPRQHSKIIGYDAHARRLILAIESSKSTIPSNAPETLIDCCPGPTSRGVVWGFKQLWSLKRVSSAFSNMCHWRR